MVRFKYKYDSTFSFWNIFESHIMDSNEYQLLLNDILN